MSKQPVVKFMVAVAQATDMCRAEMLETMDHSTIKQSKPGRLIKLHYWMR